MPNDVDLAVRWAISISARQVDADGITSNIALVVLLFCLTSGLIFVTIISEVGVLQRTARGIRCDVNHACYIVDIPVPNDGVIVAFVNS